MYVLNEKTEKRIPYFSMFFTLVFLFIIVGGLIWYFIIRDSGSVTASFKKVEQKTISKTDNTKIVTTDYFSIRVPQTWESNGKKNPYFDQVFIELQDKKKNYDARWIRVFVDTFPQNYPINSVIAITNSDNKLSSGESSGDCSVFPGAPKYDPKTNPTGIWPTKWQGISFTCDIARPLNQTGAASVTTGYGQKLTSPSGKTHTYFLVYIDHTSRPDNSVFGDAINTFQPL